MLIVTCRIDITEEHHPTIENPLYADGAGEVTLSNVISQWVGTTSD